MKRVLFTLETGFVGASFEEEFEFEDDVTDSDINYELADLAEDKMRDIEYRWEERWKE